ncbi:MAG: NADH-quinone oxidoreductase subunit NuoK [Candidatus Melainabacteria bacterium]|nr:NADH-quinone oxidoreductase subunit NuoK [Candidatus Melainabacteria bacterium]
MSKKERLFSLLKLFTTAALISCFLFLAVNLSSILERYILLSTALFSIGIYGLTASRNVIRVLMSIELLLNAVNVNLVAFSNFVDPLEIKGQVFALFVMAIAAAEAAIALAIILAIYRNMASVDMEDFASLKW